MIKRSIAVLALLTSVFVVGGAAPAHANCATVTGHKPCALVCAVGLGNKHTAPLFQWCYIA